MTREEEIIQMSKKTALEDWHEGQAGYFEAKEYLRKGAEWADQHPRKGLWDSKKIIKFIKDNVRKYHKSGVFHVDDFINDLTKTMEK